MSHPIGHYFAIAGGLIAQDPNPSIGLAGLIVAVTGLASGLYQYYRAYLDNRLAMRRLDVSDDRIGELQNALEAAKISQAATARELEQARERNHNFQDSTAATLNSVQADTFEVKNQCKTNTEVIQKLVPATKDLAARTGLADTLALPDPPPTMIKEK